MKKLRLIIATLLVAPLGVMPAQAQVDVTENYLVNPSFEGTQTQLAASTETMDLGTGGGAVKEPQGWTVTGAVTGWKGIDVVGGEGNPNAAQATDGEYLFNLWCATLTNVQVAQTVAGLPNGLYTITCDMMVSAWTGGSRMGGQRIFANGVETRYENEWEYTPEEGDYAALRTLSVTTSVTDGTLTFGIRTDNVGSVNTINGEGWLKADNFRLYMNGGSEEEIVAFLRSGIQSKLDILSSQDWSYGFVPGAYIFLGDIDSDFMKRAKALSTKGTDTDYMGKMIDSLSVYIGKYSSLCDLTMELNTLCEEANEIVTNANPLIYTGLPDFQNYLYDMIDVFNNETATEVEFRQIIDGYSAAVQAFELSIYATLDEPADFTNVIQSALFTKAGGDPSVSGDRVSTGWVSEQIAVSGDYRLNTVGGKNCWNSWSPDFTEMKLYQVITKLPAGLYSVSCETATDGAIHDQHAFAASSSGIAVSPVPTTQSPEGSFPGGGLWEEIQTEKVLVMNDGILTIGMASTSGGGTSGWFCATNFKLLYYGNEGADTEYAKAFAAYLAHAEELTAQEMLVSEKDKLNECIAAAKAADVSTKEKAEAATVALNVGVSAAETGIYNMKNFRHQNYKAVADSAAVYLTRAEWETLGNVFTASLAAVDMVCANDTTTHAAYVGLNAELKAYLDFGNTFSSALYTYRNPDVYDGNAITSFSANMESIAKALLPLNADAIAEATREMEKAIYTLRDYSTLDGKGVSFWLKNPGFDEATYDNGWTNQGFVRNTALLTKDDGYSGKYAAETWIAYNSRLADKTMSQTVYVPNGFYTITVTSTACQQGTFDILEEDGETVKESVSITTPVKGVWLFANNDSVEVATPMIGEEAPYENQTVDNEPHSKVFTLAEVEVTNMVLNFGLKTRSTTANWVAFDSFTLSCVRRTSNVDTNEIAEDALNVPLVYVENGYIQVVGAESFTITTIDGKTVPAHAQLPSGIYIVKVGTQAVQVAIHE